MRAKLAIGVGVILAGMALAQTVSKSLGLVINGKPATVQAVQIGGKTYVPVDALKAAGATATLSGNTLTLTLPGASAQTAGGANQRISVEGCRNEFLFNGIWRMRITKVEAIRRPNTGDPGTPGYGVTLEIRNGVSRSISLSKTGIQPSAKGIDLVMPDGNTLELSGVSEWVDVAFKSVPQGAGITYQLKYYYPYGTADAQVQQPQKFLLEINTKELANWTETKDLKYGTANPSFRVDLTCTK